MLYTTSCKHSLALLRMGEIIARNMLSWLKLLIKLFLLHLVGCLYYWTLHTLHAFTSKDVDRLARPRRQSPRGGNMGSKINVLNKKKWISTFKIF